MFSFNHIQTGVGRPSFFRIARCWFALVAESTSGRVEWNKTGSWYPLGIYIHVPVHRTSCDTWRRAFVFNVFTVWFCFSTVTFPDQKGCFRSRWKISRNNCCVTYPCKNKFSPYFSISEIKTDWVEIYLCQLLIRWKQKYADYQ